MQWRPSDRDARLTTADLHGLQSALPVRRGRDGCFRACAPLALRRCPRERGGARARGIRLPQRRCRGISRVADALYCTLKLGLSPRQPDPPALRARI